MKKEKLQPTTQSSIKLEEKKNALLWTMEKTRKN